MPPSAVTTYEDLLCYEYAKLIAAAADMQQNYGFIMDRMQKLKQGDIEMSDVVREDRYTVEQGKEECIYCGSEDNLSWENIIPLADGGAVVDEVVDCLDVGGIEVAVGECLETIIDVDVPG